MNKYSLINYFPFYGVNNSLIFAYEFPSFIFKTFSYLTPIHPLNFPWSYKALLDLVNSLSDNQFYLFFPSRYPFVSLLPFVLFGLAAVVIQGVFSFTVIFIIPLHFIFSVSHLPFLGFFFSWYTWYTWYSWLHYTQRKGAHPITALQAQGFLH